MVVVHPGFVLFLLSQGYGARGWVCIPALLPCHGRAAREAKEQKSSSAARLTIHFFCSQMSGREGEGDPEPGFVLRGQEGGRGEREERRKEKGKKQTPHITFRKGFHRASQPVTTQELLETTTRAEAMAVAPSPSPSPRLPGSSSPTPARPSSDPARQHLSRQRSL